VDSHTVPRCYSPAAPDPPDEAVGAGREARPQDLWAGAGQWNLQEATPRTSPRACSSSWREDADVSSTNRPELPGRGARTVTRPAWLDPLRPTGGRRREPRRRLQRSKQGGTWPTTDAEFRSRACWRRRRPGPRPSRPARPAGSVRGTGSGARSGAEAAKANRDEGWRPLFVGPEQGCRKMLQRSCRSERGRRASTNRGRRVRGDDW